MRRVLARVLVQQYVTADLTFLELFSLVVAVHIWADHFHNSKICFWCDNQVVVHVVNRQSFKSVRVMHLVRAFVLQGLRINALFLVKRVPGVQNGVANALFRFQEACFRQLAPSAHVQVHPVPPW